ncbi:hypothetical protein M595_1402 [Lyngbya aestuarii BL J]|uniref:Uncharacterized protein n=1 Tax=Lyngbya aestuarii BL J TaxID=1348334 RepID=U7QQ81_9CYAN|nr:hypothetical protein M595_1402 [Lyngbya aestuarii BL J]
MTHVRFQKVNQQCAPESFKAGELIPRLVFINGTENFNSLRSFSAVDGVQKD